MGLIEIVPDALMHYGSMGAGAVCGDLSSVGRSITMTTVVEWVTCEACKGSPFYRGTTDGRADERI